MRKPPAAIHSGRERHAAARRNARPVTGDLPLPFFTRIIHVVLICDTP